LENRLYGIYKIMEGTAISVLAAQKN